MQRANTQIGIVVNLEPKYPATQNADDCRRGERAHAYMNRQYLDPVFLGKYPDELKEIFGEAWPEWSAEDFDLIKQPIDFLGVNYYTRNVTKHDAHNYPLQVCQCGNTRHTPKRVGKCFRKV